MPAQGDEGREQVVTEERTSPRPSRGGGNGHEPGLWQRWTWYYREKERRQRVPFRPCREKLGEHYRYKFGSKKAVREDELVVGPGEVLARGETLVVTNVLVHVGSEVA